MIDFRSIAWLTARRTRMSSKGFLLLLRISGTSPSVEPMITWKRLSALKRSRVSVAPMVPNASMSPARSAGTWAAASGTNLKVAWRIVALD